MAVLEQSWIKVQEKTFGKWWVHGSHVCLRMRARECNGSLLKTHG
jgi:hypothetical protein